MSQSNSNGALATIDQWDIISNIVINGDLSKLSPQQKLEYYRQFCERLGLDPLTQPFSLLKLNGKETLYCGRGGTAQLNKLHKVSHEIKARETQTGCYVVTAQASTPDGRHTESIGAVTIDNLRGDALCNAMMKAETKAKRRATLDLLGLGILDESETETIPNAVRIPAPGADGNKPPTNNGTATAAAAGDDQNNNSGQRNGGKVSAFKQKYNSADEIVKVLDAAEHVKDTINLYYINAELIESLPELKAKFTSKKNELFNSQQPAAAANGSF